MAEHEIHDQNSIECTIGKRLYCYAPDYSDHITDEEASYGYPMESLTQIKKPLTINPNNEKPVTSVKQTPNADSFVKELDRKVWIDNNDSFNVEVCRNVTKFVNDLLENAMKLESNFRFEVVQNGSYFSNLRVGRPYEFDYMINLSPMLIDLNGKPAYSVSRIPQEEENGIRTSKFLYEISTQMPCLFSERAESKDKFIIEASSVLDILFPLFSRAVDVIKTRWNIKRFPEEKGNAPAFEIVIETDGVAASIDLVPCFQLYAANSQETMPQLRKDTKQFMCNIGYDAEQVYQKLYLVSSKKSFGSKHFRLSTSSIEREVFCSLEPKLLRAIRIVKYLFQTFFTVRTINCGGFWNTMDAPRDCPYVVIYRSQVPSYLISTAILNILITCGELHCKGMSHGELAIFFLKLIKQILYFSDPPDCQNCNLEDRILILNGWCFQDMNCLVLEIDNEDHVCLLNRIEACIDLINQGFLRKKPENFMDAFPLRPEVPVLCSYCYGHLFNDVSDRYDYQMRDKEYGVLKAAAVDTKHCFAHAQLRKFMPDDCVLVYERL